MDDIDIKDRRILGLAALNCRISLTALGHSVKLSKDAVAYRLRRLERIGAIKRHMMLIDARKLGFTRYHLLLRLQGGAASQAESIARISSHPFVMWVNSFAGRYDAQVIVDARDSLHLDRIRRELFALCQNGILQYSVLTHLYDYEFTNLFPEIDLKTRFDREDDGSFSHVLANRSYAVPPDVNRGHFTGLDLDILRALADDPRSTVTDIAARVSASRLTVRKRILGLIRSGLIRSFGTIADSQLFGYVTYYLLLRVAQTTPPAILRRPFKRLSNVFYSGAMMGDYDMILYLLAKTPSELKSSLHEIRTQLDPYILHYDLLVQEEVHHWRHFTPGIYEECLKRIST